MTKTYKNRAMPDIKIIYTFILFMHILPSIYAQNDFPKPQKTANRLFYIQHSNNTNTYVYDANMNGESINSSKPIDAYRILYSKNREKKPLTWIQKKFAYGILQLESSSDYLKLRLAASKEFLFYLRNEHAKGPRIDITINDRQILLDRMFVQIKDGTSGLGMKAEYVLFYGKDFHTKEPVIEKVLMD